MNIWGRRIVGALQIAGGATGLLWSVAALGSETARLNPLYEEMLVFVISGLSVYAGVLVLESRPQGLFLAKIVQLLSVPVLFSPVLSYQFLSGLTARLSLSSASGVQTFWANGLMVRLNSGDSFSVGVDVLALGLFVYLHRCSFDKQAVSEMHIAETFD